MTLNTFRRLDDSRLGTRLHAGFGLFLLLFIGYALFSVQEMEKLAQLGFDIYRHPMAATQAVGDANIGILKMHRAMLQIPRSSDAQLAELVQAVEENRTKVERSFLRIEERFLGSSSRVITLQRSFDAWEPIRAEVIRLRREGRVAESARETEVEGSRQVTRIEKDMDAITAFAGAKAAQFVAGMESTRNRIRIITWCLIAVGLLVSTATALLIARSIRVPVVALSGAASKVAAGDYTQHVDFAAKSELGTLAGVFNMMVRAIREQTETIRQKNEENERLLLNILPAPIAGRLKNGESTIADSFGEVSVLFADIVGFTQFSSALPVTELVQMLNELFSAFDAIAAREGVEKIKTIGDAYMAVSGMPSQRKDHSEVIISLATGMMEAVEQFNRRRGTGLTLRIGINRGPVVAGVIGTHKFIYDLWGDTVNIASRMESTGVPGRIQVTREAYEYLKDHYDFDARGEVAVKGKGMMQVYLLKVAETVCAG